MTSTTSGTRFSRRALLEGAGAAAVGVAVTSGPLGRAAAAAAKADAGHRPLVNPLVLQRADAQIQRHTNGLYYMTASVLSTTASWCAPRARSRA
jgi:hypothetical protein